MSTAKPPPLDEHRAALMALVHTNVSMRMASLDLGRPQDYLHRYVYFSDPEALSASDWAGLENILGLAPLPVMPSKGRLRLAWSR